MKRRHFRQAELLGLYRRLRRAHGHAGWWPGRTAFEVCIGAILVQNTAWTNVEKALVVLRKERRLSYRGLSPLTPARLAPLIRSSGTHQVKARRVMAFVRWLGREYGGSTRRMAREEAGVLRRKLLAVHGIGPETADSIALYAAGKPLFVVDAYTRRVFPRLGFLSGAEPYDEVQGLFMSVLPEDAPLFNDYHAQIVRLGKEHCRSKPLCPGCPLDAVCPRHGVS
jgi:endonuclease-3 related protein